MTESDIQHLFATRGLRCTRQRVAIFEALLADETHPTADDLFRKCASHGGAKGDCLSLATIYNTLEVLCEAGLAQKLPGAGENGSARYDAAHGRGHHLHLRDHATGRVDDVPDDLSQRFLDHIPPQLLRELEEKLGFKIAQVQIELVGRYEAERLQPLCS